MATANELAAKLAAVEKKADALAGSRIVETKTKGYTPKASEVFGAPTIRMGESVMSSRGYRFTNAIKAHIAGDWSQAKVEKGLHDLIRPNTGALDVSERSVLAPFGCDLFPDDMRDDDGFGRRIKSLVYAGVEDADPNEVEWLQKKSYQGGTRKDMSWLDQASGGALVGPPAQGELIDLFRNQAALTQAGVTTIPLPPGGRIQYPRQTSATTGYWLGESQVITASQPGTGLLTLSAKKCAAYTPIPNELIRYGGPAAEALVRKDLAVTLALTIDLAGLQGAGSDTAPRGIQYTPGVQTVTPTTVATDGDTLAEQDLYQWMSKIEAANGQFEAFIMTPTLYYYLLAKRSGAANATDKGGLFTFSPFRQLGDAVNSKNINGYRVVTSNQVSKTVVKGSGTTLTTLFGGQWSDALLAMFGAIEFAVTTQSDTAFKQDQTWIRSILTGDFGARHPGVFAYATSLLQA
jgi:HK97 family phage major capsid protein